MPTKGAGTLRIVGLGLSGWRETRPFENSQSPILY
jgi:hypothetical protein